MTDKILDFEQPSEDVIENYEEFDYLTDFYLPFQDQETKYSSDILKGFRENNIDPYEFLGEKKVNGIQPIELLKPEEQEQGKIDYSEAFVEFFKDLPESVALSTLENLANISNLGVQAVGVGANLAFKDTKLDKISDVTNSAASFYNRNTEQFVKNIETYAKNNDVNGVSKFITDIGIDTGLSVPIYKQLKKVGVPSFAAMPLSFGLAYGFSGGEKEIDNNMLMDSQAINRTFELLNILPDTPESEIAEAVATAFEGTLWTAAIGPLTKTFKLLKNNVPAYINQQTAVSVGGAAATGEAVTQVNENNQDNLNVETDQNQDQELNQEEKDELIQLLDQSELSNDLPADNLIASIGPNATRLAVQYLKNQGTKVQNLEKLSGGTGRKVFKLDDDKVIKIAAKQRGVRENLSETNDYVIAHWRPQVFESGDDYVVVEAVRRVDGEVRQFLKPLQKLNQYDFDNKTGPLQDAMTALGLEDFMNYNLVWRDFTAPRNWGKTNDGRLVLIDGGALDKDTLLKTGADYKDKYDYLYGSQMFKENADRYFNESKKEWDQILRDRRKEGMGKFVITITGGSSGYKVLDSIQNNIISEQTN
jgi:hypothetical protein